MLGAGVLVSMQGSLHAAVSAEEAAKLGASLTAIGAEKAGNKDGTIPEYTGGLTTAPAGFVKGSVVRPDPFAAEKPLFSIDAKNMAQYADKLTEGTKALMKQHADFRIDVYKTHRTAAHPQSVLDNTKKNATRASTTPDMLGMKDTKAGIAFPIPKNGNEVMFNFQTRYQGVSYVLPKFSAFNIDSAGKLTTATQGLYTGESPYYVESNDTGILGRVRGNYTGPARRAGEANLVYDYVDSSTKERRAWTYLPGQRRVRLAPDLSYDTPNPSTGGMAVYDETNMFNGKLDRFDFKLVGKKEIFVPYNAYKFAFHNKPDEVFGPKFVTPSNVRWELHRMWVVEATVKEGKRHIYSKRTFYIDEDSWYVLASDQYDARNQLWRAGIAYMAPSYDAAIPSAHAYGHYDVIAGTYYINMWPVVAGAKYPEVLSSDSAWTPEALAGSGIR